MLSIWKIVFVLVVGCMVVYKFVEWLFVSVMLLIEIMDEVGLLGGVYNFVYGFGESVGKLLIEYLLVKVVVFVGEMIIGSYIMW